MAFSSKMFLVGHVCRQSAGFALFRRSVDVGRVVCYGHVDRARKNHARSLSQSESESESHPTQQTADLKMKVLYDGDCPLCMQEIKFVEYVNKKRKTLHLVNIASPDYQPENHGNISYEKAMAVMHVVGPNQQVHTGVDAMYQMYSALGMRWAVAYMRWPVLSGLFDGAYAVFARNRLGWTAGRRSCETGKCPKPKDPPAQGV